MTKINEKMGGFRNDNCGGKRVCSMVLSICFVYCQMKLQLASSDACDASGLINYFIKCIFYDREYVRMLNGGKSMM